MIAIPADNGGDYSFYQPQEIGVLGSGHISITRRSGEKRYN